MKTVALLGPKGTFSHQVFSENFEKCKAKFVNTIRDVFEDVSKNGTIGVVPIENSIGGTVGQTLDALMGFKVNITEEILLPIKHNLCGHQDDMSKITTLYCHPQTYSQCEMFIRKNLKSVKVVNTASNSTSAEMLIESSDDNAAAIIPKVAAMIYTLPILKSNIQDNENNTTRFIVISKEVGKVSTKDRTSLSLHPQVDRPGLLYEILGYFAENKINLTKIESLPTKGKLGDYLFFIEIEGNTEEDNVNKAFKALKEVGDLKVYGSYKRMY